MSAAVGPTLALTAPSRLHFGLLSWGPRSGGREFGGLGLAIRDPGLRLLASPAESWDAEGPLAARLVDAGRAVADHYGRQGRDIRPLRYRVERCPLQHVGLGSGTQVALAAGRLAQRQLDEPNLDWLDVLCRATGRGRRSGVGLHAFERGGLIVDGGGREGRIPPLVAWHSVPSHWRVVVLIPEAHTAGLHGREESEAFRILPPPSATLTERLSRLVLLELLPALVETDLTGFGDALEDIQRHVGASFAKIQGGAFGRSAERAIAILKAHGMRGVGQSSWGPAVYGFTDAGDKVAESVVSTARSDLGLDPDHAYWTVGTDHGAIIEVVDDEPGGDHRT